MSDEAATAPTSYRMSRAVPLRFLGRVMLVLGGLLLGLVMIDAAVGIPPGFVGGLVAIAAVVATTLVAMVVWPPKVLDLTSEGYVVRRVPASQVRAATWREVEGVTETDSAQGGLVVIRLTDGRTSIVPLTLLGAQALPAQEEIHRRLNTAHGYRSL